MKIHYDPKIFAIIFGLTGYNSGNLGFFTALLCTMGLLGISFLKDYRIYESRLPRVAPSYAFSWMFVFFISYPIMYIMNQDHNHFPNPFFNISCLAICVQIYFEVSEFLGDQMVNKFDSVMSHITGEPYYGKIYLRVPREPEYTDFVPPAHWKRVCPECGARVDSDEDGYCVCWNCNYGADGDSSAYTRVTGRKP